MKSIERNSNFELMRIISMLFIILWHMYIFGNIRDGNVVENSSIKVIFQFLSFIFIVHVNSYILLSGYFSWNKNIKIANIFSIITQSLFYKILFVSIFFMVGAFSITKIDIIRNIFPLELNYSDSYWFIRYYIYLYMLIPFINILINKINKKQYQKLLFILIFIFSFIPFITGTKSMENNGYTLYQFILMYIIGGFIGKYNIKENMKISLNLYRIILVSTFLICSIFNFCIFKTTELLKIYNSVYNEIFGNVFMMHKMYSNPLVIIQSISFFLLFGTLNFKSKYINRISKLTLGIYLIHNNFYIRQVIYKYLKIDGGPYYSYKFILYYFFIGIVIFILCALIEYIRQLIFKFIRNRKFSKKFSEKFYNFINSVKILE